MTGENGFVKISILGASVEIDFQSTSKTILKLDSLLISDPVKVRNVNKLRNVSANSIKFKYPNVDFEADHSNERTVTLFMKDKSATTFGVKLEFENKSLRKTGIDGVLQFPIHPESVLEKLRIRLVLPQQEMLVNFLASLETKWIVFVRFYLNADVKVLRQLLLKDINETLSLRKLNWSHKIQVKKGLVSPKSPVWMTLHQPLTISNKMLKI